MGCFLFSPSSAWTAWPGMRVLLSDSLSPSSLDQGLAGPRKPRGERLTTSILNPKLAFLNYPSYVFLIFCAQEIQMEVFNPANTRGKQRCQHMDTRTPREQMLSQQHPTLKPHVPECAFLGKKPPPFQEGPVLPNKQDSPSGQSESDPSLPSFLPG